MTVTNAFGFMPNYAVWQRFNIPLFTLYILLHLAALAAPFTFSWPGLWLFAFLSFATTCLGITVCYHRHLAHRSYRLAYPLTIFFALLGCLAFQRGPVWWVACHRLHHSQVDYKGDPHSPRYSFLWSHFLWPFFWHPQLDKNKLTLQKLAPDIYNDRWLLFLEKNYTLINILFLALLFTVGYLWDGWREACSFLVWGGFLRIIYVLNCTWLVNSAAHLWGYRRFDTPDDSRNNWFVALLTWGEGWHNNHHAHPRCARMGLTFGEFDITYWIIHCLSRIGLASDINTQLSTAPNAPKHI